MIKSLTKITVTTQRELDEIPLDFKGRICLESQNNAKYLIVKNIYLHPVEAFGTTKVMAVGKSCVIARENSKVEARGNSTVMAYENSSVEAGYNSTVIARENSSVEAWDKALIVAYGNSKVAVWNNSSVEAWENSSITSRDYSTIEAHDNSIVLAWDNSVVKAFDNSNIVISNPLNLKDYRTNTIVEEQNYNSYKSFLKEKSSEEWNTFTERKKQISRFINIHLNELKSSIKVCEEAKSQLKKAKSLEDLKKFDLI